MPRDQYCDDRDQLWSPTQHAVLVAIQDFAESLQRTRNIVYVLLYKL